VFLEWPHSNMDWALVNKKSNTTPPSNITHTSTIPVLPPLSQSQNHVHPLTTLTTPPNKKPQLSHASPSIKTTPPSNITSKKCVHTPTTLATPPNKKPQLLHLSPAITRSVQPIGTQWSNNSCVYDAVITILFNIWHNLSHTHQSAWTNLGNNSMAALLNGFQNHTSVVHTPHTSGLALETIWDNFRQLLANTSEEFEFCEFTSVHSILEQLLNTGKHVTSSTWQCSSCEHFTGRETTTTSCLVYTSALPGVNSQTHLVLLTARLQADEPSYFWAARELCLASCLIIAQLLLLVALSGSKQLELSSWCQK